MANLATYHQTNWWSTQTLELAPPIGSSVDMPSYVFIDDLVKAGNINKEKQKEKKKTLDKSSSMSILKYIQKYI